MWNISMFMSKFPCSGRTRTTSHKQDRQLHHTTGNWTRCGGSVILAGTLWHGNSFQCLPSVVNHYLEYPGETQVRIIITNVFFKAHTATEASNNQQESLAHTTSVMLWRCRARPIIKVIFGAKRLGRNVHKYNTVPLKVCGVVLDFQ